VSEETCAVIDQIPGRVALLWGHWLRIAYLSVTVTHHEGQFDTTAAFPMFPHKHPIGVASRSRQKDPSNEIGSPQTAQPCPPRVPVPLKATSVSCPRSGGAKGGVSVRSPTGTATSYSGRNIDEFEVFQVLKHSDKVYNLPIGPFG
jgi:hypothetical protein